jgi:hypothetical protein
LSLFSPYSKSYNVSFSFSLLVSFFRHIPCPIECIFHFSRLSVFLATFQVIQCLFLIFHVFQFSNQNPGPRVCISHTSRFSLFHSIFQVIQCLYLIFHVFQVSCHSTVPTMYFSYLKFPMYFKYLKFSLFCIYCMSHSVCFSFHTFFSVFLAIFHVLLCEFLLFLVCQFSRHIPGPIVCISQYVTYSTVFCHISCPTM